MSASVPQRCWPPKWSGGRFRRAFCVGVEEVRAPLPVACFAHQVVGTPQDDLTREILAPISISGTGHQLENSCHGDPYNRRYNQQLKAIEITAALDCKPF
jgi:hypothetical protein